MGFVPIMWVVGMPHGVLSIVCSAISFIGGSSRARKTSISLPTGMDWNIEASLASE